eukprot:1139082-Amorphochlora_amoeboformis.AAC.1
MSEPLILNILERGQGNRSGSTGEDDGASMSNELWGSPWISIDLFLHIYELISVISLFEISYHRDMAPYHIIKLNQPCLGSSCHEVLGASSEKDLLSDFSPFGNRGILLRNRHRNKEENYFPYN